MNALRVIAALYAPAKKPGSRRDAHRSGVSTDGITEKPHEPDEVEFLRAMDRYKREFRRPFPSCSEVLAVAKEVLKRQGWKEPDHASTLERSGTS